MTSLNCNDNHFDRDTVLNIILKFYVNNNHNQTTQDLINKYKLYLRSFDGEVPLYSNLPDKKPKNYLGPMASLPPDLMNNVISYGGKKTKKRKTKKSHNIKRLKKITIVKQFKR